MLDIWSDFQNHSLFYKSLQTKLQGYIIHLYAVYLQDNSTLTQYSRTVSGTCSCEDSLVSMKGSIHMPEEIQQVILML